MRTPKTTCPKCKQPLTSVRNYDLDGKIVSLYPKTECERRGSRYFREYRYYCGGCNAEWLYTSADRAFSRIPRTSQQRFDSAIGLLVDRH